jgi:hypothetical protein
MVGKIIVDHGKVVRPSQLIRGVGPTLEGAKPVAMAERDDGNGI